MQKVVFYIGSLARGGAQRVISTLANALVCAGYSCVVITSYKTDNEYELDERIRRIVLLKNSKKNFIKENLIQVFELRRILKEESPDSVVSFMAEPNFRLIFSSFGLKCKKILSVRNDPSREYPNFLYVFLAKLLFRFADCLVFQTLDAQRWFPKRIQNKSRIILNPVGNHFFDSSFYGIRKDIVSVGRLTWQKNHEMTIKAFAKISSQIKDNLIIFGDGPIKRELQQLVSSLKLNQRVFFPGIEENISEKIKSAKLFVLSSNYEGLPNSLMEAMALGVPCISTDCPCGGPKMLLNPSYLVNVNDDSQLSCLMKKIDDVDFFENNYRVDAKIFQEKNIVKEWIKVIL